jgi:hypothetical protein
MAAYRAPFANAGEDRRPTLTWPRQIPIEGEPPEVVRVATDCGRWLAESRIPKLFINAEPGAILTGRQRETPGARQPAFSFILGSLAHNCRLRGDAYDPQRPGALQCGGCEGLSVAPLHSRSVCSDLAKFAIIHPNLRLDYKVATHP